MLYDFVVRHAAFLHDAFDAVDVLLRSALADVDADVMVFAVDDFVEVSLDVLPLTCPRGVDVVVPVIALLDALALPDGDRLVSAFGHSARQQDGQFGIDVTLRVGRNLYGCRDEVCLPVPFAIAGDFQFLQSRGRQVWQTVNVEPFAIKLYVVVFQV